MSIEITKDPSTKGNVIVTETLVETVVKHGKEVECTTTIAYSIPKFILVADSKVLDKQEQKRLDTLSEKYVSGVAKREEIVSKAKRIEEEKPKTKLK